MNSSGWMRNRAPKGRRSTTRSSRRRFRRRAATSIRRTRCRLRRSISRTARARSNSWPTARPGAARWRTRRAGRRAPRRRAEAGAGGEGADRSGEESPSEGPWESDAVAEDAPQLSPQQGQGGRGAAGSGQPPVVRPSPDGKWEALIENFNVFLRPVGQHRDGDAAELRRIGRQLLHVPVDCVVARFAARSPPTAAARLRAPGALHRVVADRPGAAQALHARLSQAGRRARYRPAGALRRGGQAGRSHDRQHAVSESVLALSASVWWKDSRGFTFEYNQRGHQVYRVIEVEADTGEARALIDEESQDVLRLPPHGTECSRYRQEFALRPRRRQRDHLGVGARRLGASLSVRRRSPGKVKNQITKGDWVVRDVDQASTRRSGRSGFAASGMDPGQDPYFVQLLPHQLRRHGPHQAHRRRWRALGDVLARSRSIYVDTWSRVDLPTQWPQLRAPRTRRF